MITQTKALVLSSLKYGDTSKVVKLYTQSHGLKSFIAKGVYTKKNKTNALLNPLNSVELIFDNRSSSNLLFFKEIRQFEHYQSLYQSQQKMAIVLFLAEVLHTVLQEEETNEALFQFISSTLLTFDEKQSDFADFHLWFLFQLTHYLGFYPHLDSNSNYFDLKEGVSTDQKPAEVFISKLDLEFFLKLSQIEFSIQSQNEFSQKQRKSILTTLLRYYELHISNFRQPKSLEVLSVIFG
jgi:DNA repair protein RecO (recombination protein O)